MVAAPLVPFHTPLMYSSNNSPERRASGVFLLGWMGDGGPKTKGSFPTSLCLLTQRQTEPAPPVSHRVPPACFRTSPWASCMQKIRCLCFSKLCKSPALSWQHEVSVHRFLCCMPASRHPLARTCSCALVHDPLHTVSAIECLGTGLTCTSSVSSKLASWPHPARGCAQSFSSWDVENMQAARLCCVPRAGEQTLTLSGLTVKASLATCPQDLPGEMGRLLETA